MLILTMVKKIELATKQVLLKIGAFLKTDIRYIIRQGSWLAMGQIINNLLGILLIVAFANLIPPATYGIYKYILSVYGIFSLFALSDMGTAVSKSVAEGNEAIYKPALKAEIKWGLFGSLGLIVLAVYYFLQDNSVFGFSFVIAAACLPFFESLNTYQHILSGKKRFDLQAKYYVGTRILSALGLISTVFFTTNVLALLLAYFLPYIIANLIFGPLSLKRLELNNNFNPQALTYGKHLSLLGAVSFGAIYLESIIVFKLLGPVELAIFSLALAPAGRLQSFFSIIPEISFPKFTERPMEEIRATILNRVFKAMLICTVIVIAYIIVVPFFFSIFLPKYISAIPYAQILAIPFIWYPSALFSRILSAKGATGYLYKYSVIEAFMQLSVMFFAVYFFGLLGASVGKVLSSAISTSILFYYFRKL